MTATVETDISIKSAKQLLDTLTLEVEAQMREEGTFPNDQLKGWSFLGKNVWSVELRDYEPTAADRAMAVLEAIQLFCFSPSATYVSFFFVYETPEIIEENGMSACMLVADNDKICGYFGAIAKDEDGNIRALKKYDTDNMESVREFDHELFGAFSGVMQYSADPIEDVQAIVNVLESRGHKVTIH